MIIIYLDTGNLIIKIKKLNLYSNKNIYFYFEMKLSWKFSIYYIVDENNLICINFKTIQNYSLWYFKTLILILYALILKLFKNILYEILTLILILYALILKLQKYSLCYFNFNINFIFNDFKNIQIILHGILTIN